VDVAAGTDDCAGVVEVPADPPPANSFEPVLVGMTSMYCATDAIPAGTVGGF
jgi:hypothetical protein